LDYAVLSDSKKLSEKQRDRLYDEIIADRSNCWHSDMIEPEEIGRINNL